MDVLDCFDKDPGQSTSDLGMYALDPRYLIIGFPFESFALGDINLLRRCLISRKNQSQLMLMLKRIQLLFLDLFDGVEVAGHTFRRPTMDSRVFRCKDYEPR